MMNFVDQIENLNPAKYLGPSFCEIKFPRKQETIRGTTSFRSPWWWGAGGVLGLLGVCRWPLRAPTLLYSILWPILDPILVTFWQICNFHDPGLINHFLFL